MSTNTTKNNSTIRKKGFTLVEAIVCLLIVTLVTSLLVVMTGTAKKSYVNLEKSSEGQVLCGILTSAIQDELRYATNIKQYGSSTKSIKVFENSNTEYTCYPFTYNSNSELLTVAIDCSIEPYEGKLCIVPGYSGTVSSSSRKVAITSDASYMYGLTADADMYYCSSEDLFYVDLKILDGTTEIMEQTFVVTRLPGVK